MLITKECDYGLRIIRALSDNEKRTVAQISEVEHIPHTFAYKILKKLQNAGFVENRLGSKGGYILVKPLNSIYIYDVVIAISDNLYLNECLRPDDLCTRNTIGEPCAVHKEFDRIQNILMTEMKAKNIEQIVLGL